MLFIHSQRPSASFSCFCPCPTWFIVWRILIMWRSFSLLLAPFPSALSLGFHVFGTRFNVSNAKLRRMLSAEHCFGVITLEMVACRQWKNTPWILLNTELALLISIFDSYVELRSGLFVALPLAKQWKSDSDKKQQGQKSCILKPGWSASGAPMCDPPPHSKSVHVSGGQSYLSLSNNQRSRRGHAVEESRAPPTFRSVLSDKDCWGIRKQRPSLYGWCFKSSGSADEEWGDSNEMVSSAGKCIICLRVPVLNQSSAQLITGTQSQFLINSGTT